MSNATGTDRLMEALGFVSEFPIPQDYEDPYSRASRMITDIMGRATSAARAGRAFAFAALHAKSADFENLNTMYETVVRASEALQLLGFQTDEASANIGSTAVRQLTVFWGIGKNEYALNPGLGMLHPDVVTAVQRMQPARSFPLAFPEL